jgi:hypothetical protein
MLLPAIEGGKCKTVKREEMKRVKKKIEKCEI